MTKTQIDILGQLDAERERYMRELDQEEELASMKAKLLLHGDDILSRAAGSALTRRGDT